MLTQVFLEQGSEEWLEFRRTKRMASETPAVMGLSPYQRQSDIRRIKNGGGSGFVNNAMRQGTQQEPIAREAYIRDFVDVRPAVYVNGDYGASLDGINIDQTLIWECKVPVDGCRSERWQLALEGKLTPYDYAQVQHQLMVTGAEMCHFFVWDAELQSYVITDVLPEPDYWLSIEMEWESFWKTLGLRTDRAWAKAVKEYKNAKEIVEISTRLYDEKKQTLMELLVGESNEGSGVRVQRITVAGRTDWKRVEKELLLGADLTQYKTSDSTQIRINEIKE
jgi:putative phage-type endonuclease